MKSKKILLVILMSLIVIIANINIVYADSFNVNIVPNTSTYSEGQTVILTVSLADINATDGIYGLSGTLEYKTDVFEEIVSDSSGNTTQITTLNNWGNATYNSTTREFSILTTTPATNSQSIMQISLKVKEGATLGKTFVMLNNLQASNGQNDIETSTATATVTIAEENSEIPSITPTPTPISTPTPTPTAKPVATTTPSSKLPQTGIGDSPMPIILGALLISLVSFIAYRRYKDI